MKDLFKHNKPLNSIILETAEVAGYLWQRGWAERNAGNISINISEIVDIEITDYSPLPFLDLPFSYPKLADCSFLVTGTGKRMRDLAHEPMKNAFILRVNQEANGYWILSQKAGSGSFLPTSELPTHLGIHQLIAERESSEKVVMHAHTTELIALTHAEEFCNQDSLNNLLWGMHPETIVFVPKGVGFVPYMRPGSVEIAVETIKALQNHDVALWEKHGVFAIGKCVGKTFDVIDILAKSARIYFMCQSANILPKGLTNIQLSDLKLLTTNF